MGSVLPSVRHEDAVTRASVPPLNPILTRYCLKMRKLPIEWIVAHALKQLGGRGHDKYGTTGNITAQACLTRLGAIRLALPKA